MTVIRALAGESLDALVWRATGYGSGAVETVIEANPGIAAIAEALPEHHPVALPALTPPPATIDIVQLWS